jgi:hypothetical protein
MNISWMKVFLVSVLIIFPLNSWSFDLGEYQTTFDEAMTVIESNILESIDPDSEVISERGLACDPENQSKPMTLKFKIKIDESGQGTTSSKKRCYGKWLCCKAKIVSPSGDYNVKISTDAGTKVGLNSVKDMEEKIVELETKKGLKKTVFTLSLEKLNHNGQSAEAAIDLVVTYQK